MEDRFWAKVNKNGPIPAHRLDLGPCWLWTGTDNGDGYGVMRVGSRNDGTRRQVKAHRLAYELLVGPIPQGMQPDHLCRNRACVNPTHIEPVTSGENTRRGLAGAHQVAKTHCPQGHSYSGANLYRDPRGQRQCRACHNEASRLRRSRRAA